MYTLVTKNTQQCVQNMWGSIRITPIWISGITPSGSPQSLTSPLKVESVYHNYVSNLIPILRKPTQFPLNLPKFEPSHCRVSSIHTWLEENGFEEFCSKIKAKHPIVGGIYHSRWDSACCSGLALSWLNLWACQNVALFLCFVNA